MDLLTLYRKNLKQQACYLASMSYSQDISKQSELQQYALEHERIAKCMDQLMVSFGNQYLADFDVAKILIEIKKMKSPVRQLCLDGLKIVQDEIDDLF